MYNWLTLFIKMLSFLVIGFWGVSYLLPEQELRGNLWLAFALGFFGALTGSVIYRPVRAIISRNPSTADDCEIASALMSVGFYPEKTVARVTSYLETEPFRVVARRILVGRWPDRYEIFGPSLEVNRLQRVLSLRSSGS